MLMFQRILDRDPDRPGPAAAAWVAARWSWAIVLVGVALYSAVGAWRDRAGPDPASEVTGSTAHAPLPDGVPPGAGPAALGMALFMGAAPLQGRLARHEEALPAQASRCINCHTAKPGPALAQAWPQSLAAAGMPAGVPAAEPPGTAPGPGGRLAAPLRTELSAATLLTPLARRGGPASSYDRDRFCRAVREGVDSAYVTLPQAMPRFALDDAQCDALWRFVTAAGS